MHFCQLIHGVVRLTARGSWTNADTINLHTFLSQPNETNSQILDLL